MFHNIVDTLYNLRLERRIYNGYKRYKNNEEEIQLRKLCVRLSNEGKNVTQIHKKLNRTQDWVYKWLKRAQSVQFDLGNSP